MAGSNANGEPRAPTVRAVYRYCEAPNRKSRPPWFSKDDCLQGFIESVQRVDRHELHFVVDGEAGPGVTALMRSVGRVHQLRNAGNSGTFRHSLDIALSGPDPELVVLAEDDHVWLPEAIPTMVTAVRSRPEIEYLTTYTESAKWSHQDQLSFERGKSTRLEDAAGREWRPIRSTVMTFGSRPAALRADRWLFRAQSRGAHPNDDLIFAALQGVGRRRWALLHLARSRTASPRARRAARMLIGRPTARLWCGSRSLSAHAEVGVLPEGFEGGGR